ncbi:hypothetical protein C2869_08815 [Saccharobesus litoralis]|uniref:diguanylate cyclase n=1 Tax=Saccharobesus litoralis TaxID=2172099 RepID=A0A2S0VQR4_9ALTE|nr:diguanylate cyclase [Saccharobesus litoralis]AWB66522.1 hypothetical protein C2869_08815 [Saccharobesus litoralis]
MLRFALVTVFLLLPVAGTWALNLFEQGQGYFVSVGNEDALPDSVISDVIQDQQGFIWVATPTGLFRYDGYEFKRYAKASDGTPIRVIRSLWAGIDGRVWAGSRNDGLFVYDPNTLKIEHYTKATPGKSGLGDNYVRTITGDKHGRIWFGTANGVSFYNPQTQDIKQLDIRTQISGKIIQALLYDESGFLWVGSRKQGLNRLNLQNMQWQRVVYRFDTQDPASIIDVRSLYQTADKRVWLGTANYGVGVLTANGASQQALQWLQLTQLDSPQPFIHNWVSDFTQPDSQRLWLSTTTGGIFEIDLTSLQTNRQFQHDPSINTSLNANNIDTLYRDRQGLIWIGTWGSGLNLYNPINLTIRGIKPSVFKPNFLHYANIGSVTQLSSGEIWVGTRGHGVTRYAQQSGRIQLASGKLHKAHVMSMVQTDKHQVWLATIHQGLLQLDPYTLQETWFTEAHGLVDHHVRVLLAGVDQGLWIGTYAGLSKRLADGRFQQFYYAEQANLTFDKTINALAQTFDGTLWLGTFDGLFYVLPNDNKVYRLHAQQIIKGHLSSSTIGGLTVDRQGKLWIATSQGLDRLLSFEQQQAELQSVNRLVGIHEQSLGANMLLDKQNRIWTEEYVIDPRVWQARHLTRADGIDIGNKWWGAHSKLSDGTLVYGGSKGLLLIDPDNIGLQTLQPTLSFSRFQLSGQPISVSQHISQQLPLELPADNKSMTATFAAFDYSAPSQLQYRYRLLGFEQNWQTVNIYNRQLSYTNLPPGQYQLQIQSTDRDGHWLESGLSLSIKQVPKWHESRVLQVMAVLLVLLVLYLWYLNRLRHFRRVRRRLDRLVALKTAELETISIIGRELNQTLDVEAISNGLYNNMRQLMDCHAFAIGIVQADTQQIYMAFAIEDGQRLSPFYESMHDASRPAAHCVVSRQPLVVDHYHSLLEAVPGQVQPKVGHSMESIIYIPLLDAGNLPIAVLTVQSPRKQAYNEEQVNMCKLLASYTAIALKNALQKQELSAALAEIQEISVHDQLTGTYNRRFVSQHLPTELANLAKAQSHHASLGILLIDIDHFKQINDSYGHEAGDKVLIALSQLLKSHCQAEDWVIRWGGEEFLIISRGKSRSQLLQFASELRHKISEMTVDIACPAHSVTASFGVVAYPFLAKHPNALNWQQTLNLADIALYKAKHSGRNVCYYLQAVDEQPFEHIYEYIRHDLSACLDKKLVRFECA